MKRLQPFYLACALLTAWQLSNAQQDEANAVHAKLPPEVHDVLRKLDEFEEAERKQTDLRIAEKRKQVVEFLKSKQEELTKAGSLDSALALRTEISTLTPSDGVGDPKKDDIPKAATRHGNSYYVFVQGFINWDDAFRNARRLGGQLVQIESEPENTFVSLLTNGGDAWVGVERKRAKWQYINGKEISYSSWGDNRPSDNPVETVVKISGSKWVNVPTWNDRIDGYVIEWEGAEPVSSGPK